MFYPISSPCWAKPTLLNLISINFIIFNKQKKLIYLSFPIPYGRTFPIEKQLSAILPKKVNKLVLPYSFD